jgi:hypothetical protein
MSSSIRIQSRTLANNLVTAKTHFPLPPVPRLAQVKRYPVNSASKSLFLRTKVQPFASTIHRLSGAVKTLHAGISGVYSYDLIELGYSVRFEPKWGMYVNWPHTLH